MAEYRVAIRLVFLIFFAGVAVLCVNVLLSVEFGLSILIFEYSFCNVIGVF